MSSETSSPAEKKKTRPPAPSTAQPAPAVMYVGPDIKHPFPVATGTVFRGGLPAVLKTETSRNPDLAALFLPLKDAGKAMRQMEAGEGELMKQARAVARQNAERRK